MKAVLIDDEPLCTAGLKIDLEEVCPEIEILAAFNSPIEALSKIESLNPDLVFLDIEMPEMSGFEFLNSISKVNFKVIFVTAYDEFAVQAFRQQAVDYIMKPIQRNELKEAVNRVLSTIEENNNYLKIEALLNSMQFSTKSKKLSVPNADGFDLIPINDIIYCQSHGNYTKIFFGAESRLISRVLKGIEASLQGHNFHRVHASYLVNLDKVKSIHRNDGGYLIMENDQRINMSRSKKGEVFDKLK
ncbi:MAG: response regulator transcription factor [Saprospiraceae bacterium]|nr:response regulator transcription factor [Saprospiraceae bacterium]